MGPLKQRPDQHKSHTAGEPSLMGLRPPNVWVGIWCSWELQESASSWLDASQELLIQDAGCGGVPVWVRPSSLGTRGLPAAGVTRHGLAHGR